MIHALRVTPLLALAACVDTAPEREPVPIPMSIPAPLVAEFQRMCLEAEGSLGRFRQELSRSGRYGDVEHADFVGTDGRLGGGGMESAHLKDGSGIVATFTVTDEKRDCSVRQNGVNLTRTSDGSVSIQPRAGAGE